MKTNARCYVSVQFAGPIPKPSQHYVLHTLNFVLPHKYQNHLCGDHKKTMCLWQAQGGHDGKGPNEKGGPRSYGMHLAFATIRQTYILMYACTCCLFIAHAALQATFGKEAVKLRKNHIPMAMSLMLKQKRGRGNVLLPSVPSAACRPGTA